MLHIEPIILSFVCGFVDKVDNCSTAHDLIMIDGCICKVLTDRCMMLMCLWLDIYDSPDLTGSGKIFFKKYPKDLFVLLILIFVQV